MFREKTVDPYDMWSTGLGEVWVYRQTRTLATGDIGAIARTDDNIAAPGLVDIEVVQFQDGTGDRPVINLFIAQNVKFDFGPDFATLLTLSLDIDGGSDKHTYKPAIQPEIWQVSPYRVFSSSTPANITFSGYWNVSCQDEGGNCGQLHCHCHG